MITIDSKLYLISLFLMGMIGWISYPIVQTFVAWAKNKFKFVNEDWKRDLPPVEDSKDAKS